MNLNEMSLEELYQVKGEIITNLDIMQNDLKLINQKIMELRQMQMKEPKSIPAMKKAQ